MSIKINKADFDSFYNQSGVTVLIDFYADWCGPCRMLSPELAALESERSDIVLGKVNIDEEPELAIRFAVTVVPTVLIIREGEITDRFAGYRDKASIEELL